ncbi:MAG: alpha/beta fold hydrolase [Candidatus Zixiibacteriota bacterium]
MSGILSVTSACVVAGAITLLPSLPSNLSGNAESARMQNAITVDDLGVPSGITNCSGVQPAIGCGNVLGYGFDWDGGPGSVVWSVYIAPTPCNSPNIDGTGLLTWETDCSDTLNKTFWLWCMPDSSYCAYGSQGNYSVTVKAVGPMLTDSCNFDIAMLYALPCADSDISLYLDHDTPIVTISDENLIDPIITIGSRFYNVGDVPFYRPQVDLYWGDPAHPGAALVGRYTHSEDLWLDDSVDFSLEFDTSGIGYRDTIYIILDPDSVTCELDNYFNNRGFIVAPAKPDVDSIWDAGTGNKLVVKWLPPPDVNDIDKYQVMCVDSSTGEVLYGDPVAEDGSGFYRDVFYGLESYTPYHIRVRSYNASTGFWSDYATPIPDTTCCATVPVVLVHGWNANESVWNSHIDMLRQDRFNYVWAVDNLDSCGVAEEKNFDSNAHRLSDFIESKVDLTKDLTGIEITTINIVAHSMGGVIARRYISDFTSGWAYLRNVDNLIMLGTPNAGVPIAWFSCLLGQNFGPCDGAAKCELSQGRMKEFNRHYSNRRGVAYHTAAGTSGCLLCFLLCVPNPLCLPLGAMATACPNDGFISVSSVEAVSHDEQARGFWCHNDYMDSEQLSDSFIRPILKGESVKAPLIAAEVLGDTESIPPQISVTICDSIELWESRTDTIDVEGGDLDVALIASDQFLSFTLESPTGIIWDSLSAVTDTNVLYSSTMGMIGFVFVDAEVGTWLVHYDAQDISSQTAHFCLFAAVNNAIILQVSVSNDYPAPGDSVILTAMLTDDGSPILGAMVTARPMIEYSDTLPTVNLLDDGNSYDGAAGDGLYGAVFSQPSDSNLITFRMNATGTSTSVGLFRREASVSAYFVGFECGDTDASGATDIDDVVYLINYIFVGGVEPIPYESGDADCSGAIDIDDVVYLIQYIFSGGNAPCDPNGDDIQEC